MQQKKERKRSLKRMQFDQLGHFKSVQHKMPVTALNTYKGSVAR